MLDRWWTEQSLDRQMKTLGRFKKFLLDFCPMKILEQGKNKLVVIHFVAKRATTAEVVH